MPCDTYSKSMEDSKLILECIGISGRVIVNFNAPWVIACEYSRLSFAPTNYMRNVRNVSHVVAGANERQLYSQATWVNKLHIYIHIYIHYTIWRIISTKGIRGPVSIDTLDRSSITPQRHLEQGSMDISINTELTLGQQTISNSIEP